MMVSASSLWVPATPRRPGYFRAPPREALALPTALDSAGFVAMRAGGYRWTVQEYVDFVVTGDVRKTGGELPWSWLFWSSMDYCVEPEIARRRRQVVGRVQRTADALEEILELLEGWRVEGDTSTPDPLPVLQGWRAEDYVTSIRLTEEVLRRQGRGWPALVGVGSVCRRHRRGEAGLDRVLQAIDAALPPETRLHLFGVKGSAVRPLVERFPGRIGSVDSMAWSVAVRMDTLKAILSEPCPTCLVVAGTRCIGRLHPARRAAAIAAGKAGKRDYALRVAALDRWLRVQRGGRTARRGRRSVRPRPMEAPSRRLQEDRRAADVTKHTPAQFGIALRSWLRSVPPYEVLKGAIPGALWTQGGCAYLAAALLTWADAGELAAVWGRSQGAAWDDPPVVQHIAWRYGDLLFDGDGAAKERTFILRMMKNHWLEDVEIHPYGKAAKKSSRRGGIRCPKKKVDLLVAAIRDRFGEPEGWGFVRRPRLQRGRAAKRSRLLQRIEALRTQLAVVAQEVYEDWDWEAGGACDAISMAQGDLLAEHGIDTMDGGWPGDNHAWLIAYDKVRKEAVAVDVPADVYETGGGFCWRPIPGTRIGPRDIYIAAIEWMEGFAEEEQW